MTKKVKRGDSLSIEARDWNRLADMSNRFGNQSTPGAAQVGPEMVWVKNTLGRDLSRYAAVCLCDTTPNELATGQNDPVYAIVNGSLRDRVSSYSSGEPIVAVLQEPIANGRLGLAQISGVTPASFRYNENGSSVTSDYADISDLDDKLTFCSFGPIRVLSRTQAVNSDNSTKFYLVELGTAQGLGSACWCSSDITWSSIFGNNYGDIWATKTGDAVRVGMYQVGSTTELRLGRVGRYLVIIDYSIIWPGLSAGDRLDFMVRSPRTFATFSAGDVVPSGSHESEYVSIPAVFISGTDYYHVGQRVHPLYVLGNSPAVTIPLPGVAAYKTSSGGTQTSLSVTGRMRVNVIRLGAGPFNTTWTETMRNTAWGRAAGAGPV